MLLKCHGVLAQYDTHLLINLTELGFILIQRPTDLVDDLCLSLYWQHLVELQKKFKKKLKRKSELCTNAGAGKCNLKGKDAKKNSQERNSVPNITSQR
jgi:hypothetical protein